MDAEGREDHERFSWVSGGSVSVSQCRLWFHGVNTQLGELALLAPLIRRHKNNRLSFVVAPGIVSLESSRKSRYTEPYRGKSEIHREKLLPIYPRHNLRPTNLRDYRL